jgi:hypothetical protein
MFQIQFNSLQRNKSFVHTFWSYCNLFKNVCHLEPAKLPTQFVTMQWMVVAYSCKFSYLYNMRHGV